MQKAKMTCERCGKRPGDGIHTCTPQTANPLKGNWIVACLQRGPAKDHRYVVEIECRDEAEMSAIQSFLVKVRDEQ